MELIRIFRKTFNEILKKETIIIDNWFDKVQRKYYEKSINELKRLYDDRAAEYKILIELETRGNDSEEITASLGKIALLHNYMNIILRGIKDDQESFLNTGLLAEKSDFSDYVSRYLLTHYNGVYEKEEQLKNSPFKPTKEQIASALKEYREKRADAFFEEAHARETVKEIDEELNYSSAMSLETRRALVTKKYELAAKYFEVESGVIGKGFYGTIYRNPSDDFSYDRIITCHLSSGQEEYKEFKQRYWADKTQSEVQEMLRAGVIQDGTKGTSGANGIQVGDLQLYHCISYLTAARFTTVEAFETAEEIRQKSELNSLLDARAKKRILDFSEKRNPSGKN